MYTVLTLLILLCITGCSGGGSSEPPPLVVVADQQITLKEDEPATFSLVSLLPDRATGIEIDTVPSNGVLSGAVSSLTYVPNSNFNGNDSALVSISSGSRKSETFMLLFTVEPVDDPPTVLGMARVVSATAFRPVTFSVSVENPDELEITYSAENLPPWAEINPSTGQVSGTPTNADTETWEDLFITATNSAGSSTSQPIAIEVAWEQNVQFLASFDIPGFIQRSTLTRAAILSEAAVVVSGEGTDESGVWRVAVKMFSPLTGETFWQRLLPGSRRGSGPIRSTPFGFLVPTTDENFNGVVSYVGIEGRVPWEYRPARFSSNTTAVPRDAVELQDRRVLTVLHQGNKGSNDPFIHRLGLWDPRSGQSEEIDFDPNIERSRRAWRALPGGLGGYRLYGGERSAARAGVSDAWFKSFDRSGLEVHSVAYPGRGAISDIVELHTEDGWMKYIAGYTGLSGWLGVLTPEGLPQRFVDLPGLAPAGLIALNDEELLLLAYDEYQVRNTAGELIRRGATPGGSSSLVLPHNRYGALFVVGRQIISLPPED